MGSFWELLKKIKTSKTSYKSNYYDMSSTGTFIIEVTTVGERIDFSEKGEVKLNDGNTYQANNDIYWKKNGENIEFHRRRIDGYEKLFDINKMRDSIRPHT